MSLPALRYEQARHLVGVLPRIAPAILSPKMLNWKVHVRSQLSLCPRRQGPTHRTHSHLAHAPGGTLHGRVPCRPQAIFADRNLQEARRSRPRSPSKPPKSSRSTPPSSLPTFFCRSKSWACPSTSPPAKAQKSRSRSAPPKTSPVSAPIAPPNSATSAEAIKLVCKHFGDSLPVIGFCGAPFTLASYMIEGGGSRNYIHTKKMMYSAPAAWNELMTKLVAVTAEYSAEQVRAGADTIQIFDSWVGCLSVEDYRRYVLPHVTDSRQTPAENRRAHHLFRHRQLDASARRCRKPAPKSSASTGAFRSIPAGRASATKAPYRATSIPCCCSPIGKNSRSRAEDILRQAAGRPGHIFNLGHGILPETPVENVKSLCAFIRDHSAEFKTFVKSER